MNTDKKASSEADIRRRYITPAIEAKWDKVRDVKREVTITDGEVKLKGKLVTREKPKRADYVLYLNGTRALAVVEAKRNLKEIFILYLMVCNRQKVMRRC